MLVQDPNEKKDIAVKEQPVVPIPAGKLTFEKLEKCKLILNEKGTHKDWT